MKILTRSLVRHAHAIAREVGARAVLLSADVIEEEHDLAGLLQGVDFRMIVVTRRPTFRVPDGWEDLGQEIEMFGGATAEPLPLHVEPAVFQRLLTLASELGLEGREGRPVGTLFVLGDSDAVLAQSRQLVINPFRGYPEEERNILDLRLEETLKEFSAIDGAFIVRGDGVVLSAGRYLAPVAKLDEPLPQGLGTRHEAAAAVTLTTEALSLCVSQSTGTVSIFRRGKLLTDIQKPRGRTADGL